ncbi:MAG: glycosyltransferase family 4 protein [Candidatus Saccharimonadales bacterium]
MRVALVAGPHVPIPPHKYGGTEQVIYYLLKGLQEAGHEVIVLAPGDSEIDCEVIPITPQSIYFPKNKTETPAFNVLIQKANDKTEKALKKLEGRIDIIHSHGYDLKNFQHLPNLTTLHSKIELGDLQYYQEREDLYYVSISKNQQEACPDLQYVGVVYNGQDPHPFPIVAKPQDYVCFLGRFDRDKNPHLAIELAINLGIKIKVAGKIDIHGEGYFKEEVEKYFNHPLVEYLGELDFNEKIKLLSHSKCNLHPTGFREPFGLTVLEAAYCGTPTLAIARGSMPELIEEGRTGLLVEDFVEGYHQIEECFDMDRRYIANRSRRLFNYKTMTQQYLKAYQTVIDIFAPTDLKPDRSVLTKQGKMQLEALWQNKFDI